MRSRWRMSFLNTQTKLCSTFMSVEACGSKTTQQLSSEQTAKSENCRTGTFSPSCASAALLCWRWCTRRQRRRCSQLFSRATHCAWSRPLMVETSASDSDTRWRLAGGWASSPALRFMPTFCSSDNPWTSSGSSSVEGLVSSTLTTARCVWKAYSSSNSLHKRFKASTSWQPLTPATPAGTENRLVGRRNESNRCWPWTGGRISKAKPQTLSLSELAATANAAVCSSKQRVSQRSAADLHWSKNFRLSMGPTPPLTLCVSSNGSTTHMELCRKGRCRGASASLGSTSCRKAVASAVTSAIVTVWGVLIVTALASKSNKE